VRACRTLFSSAALRPSRVSSFGSLTPTGSFTRALRSKFLFSGMRARAGILYYGSIFSPVRRAFDHLKESTASGDSCGGAAPGLRAG
jgi:hypothetical protein